ncbi:unnamed protein product [Leptidea sinapis]|uniref:Major facilitator superfamily (MFS) profile domain-containing protein n=1 Tax=Leptidea sinapis TaxID=189913 RepID=A0A5E4QS05_9NEOP|nr:unnamed protein product [Leptidea sinapis]
MKLLEVVASALFIGVLSFGLAKIFKLRYVLVINILLMGSSTAAFVFLERVNIDRTLMDLLSTIGWASGLVGNSLLINITPRIFAVNTRASVFGCCHAFGQIGAIVCYLVCTLTTVDDIIFIVTVLAVTLVMATLCLLLPDVDKRELPDTMMDTDYFSELSKPLRWVSQKTKSPSYEEKEMRIHSFGSGGHNVSVNTNSRDNLPAQRIGFRKVLDVSLCPTFCRK